MVSRVHNRTRTLPSWDVKIDSMTDLIPSLDLTLGALNVGESLDVSRSSRALYPITGQASFTVSVFLARVSRRWAHS